MIFKYRDWTPEIGDGVYIAPTASVIGNVRLGDRCSVWFNAVIRGNFAEPMIIGEETNIQDGVVLHSDPGVGLRLGRRNTVGHNAIFHGATTGNDVLIGMGATIMNGAKIGDNAIIASNALIAEGKEVPPGVLVAGAPFRIIRELAQEEIDRMSGAADIYLENRLSFLEHLSVHQY